MRYPQDLSENWEALMRVEAERKRGITAYIRK